MNRLGTLFAIFLVASIPLVSFATDNAIVFNGLAEMYFTADYNGTPLESTGPELYFESSAEGYVEIQTKFDGVDHTLYRLTLNGSGEITAVEWKPDANQAYSTLNTAAYVLSGGDTRIDFNAFNPKVTNVKSIDNADFYAADLINSTTFQLGNFSASFNTNMFPGYYFITLPEARSSIRILCMDDGNIHPAVYWKSDLPTSWEWSLLHADAFEIPTAGIELYSQQIKVNVPYVVGQSAVLVGSQVSNSFDLSLNTGEDVNLDLMPGQYEISITEAGVEIALIRFEVLNETYRLNNSVSWIDLVGTRTGGVWATMQAGISYITPLKLAFTIKPPFDITGSSTMPYAVLKDKLDQGFYLAQDGVLRLRYDERYDETAALNLRILDMDNQEITLSSPVSRQYGTNWIELTLPSSGFTVGDFYVLEVRSEKGDLGLLRFRYDN